VPHGETSQKKPFFRKLLILAYNETFRERKGIFGLNMETNVSTDVPPGDILLLEKAENLLFRYMIRITRRLLISTYVTQAG
jgi:hypothetical protein